MIHRFLAVIPHKLYRGSAPSPADVIALYKNFGIRKIVSLDKDSGHKIDKVCRMLGIEHVLIPLHATKVSVKPLIHLLKQNLYELLIEGGPTFVHCYQGKDRTGLVVAMFKCQYMGMDCQAALKEAKDIGFGIGLAPKLIKVFSKLIVKACKNRHTHSTSDTNNADIVDNTRDRVDFMGSVIDSASMQSFAPFMDGSKWQPYNPLYQTYYDQYPTRQDLDGVSEELLNFQLGDGSQIELPQLGVRDNTSGMEGFGPLSTELGTTVEFGGTGFAGF